MSVPRQIEPPLPELKYNSDFEEYYEHLRQRVIQEDGTFNRYLGEFAALETNAQRIDFVYSRMERYNLFEKTFEKDEKNDNNALQHDSDGEKGFVTSRLNTAVSNWTRGIYKARSPGVLIQLYVHRAAGMHKLGLYKEGLRDLNRASELRVGDEPDSVATRRKFLSAQPRNKDDPCYELPPQIDGKKQYLGKRGARIKALEIKRKKSRDRVFAGKQINTGDIISVENPYQWCLFDVHQYHCHHCFCLCYVLIPCDNCTQVGFCSESCKATAQKQFHGIECPIYKTLKRIYGNYRGFHLAFKTACMEYKQGSSPLEKLVENMDPKVVKRFMHINTIIATLIFYVVKNHTQKFAGAENVESENRFKDILLSRVNMLRMYTKTIEEVYPSSETNDPTDSGQLGHSKHSVAVGLYPFNALLSHSCSPNVVVSYHGLAMVVRAIKTIPKGQELVVSYGPNYMTDPEEKRKQLLSDCYGITCKCDACEKGWNVQDISPYLLANTSHAKLIEELQANKLDQIDKAVKLFIEAKDAYASDEPSNEVSLYHNFLTYCYDLKGNRRMFW